MTKTRAQYRTEDNTATVADSKVEADGRKRLAELSREIQETQRHLIAAMY